jgi:DNA-binding CsgD family transcriptional regulator
MKEEMQSASSGGCEGSEVPAAADSAKSAIGKRLRSFYANVGTTAAVASSGTDLTQREHDVLYWLALGKTGYETSIIMGISQCTVRVHIRNTLRKLNASNIPHAVARGFRKGILHP